MADHFYKCRTCSEIYSTLGTLKRHLQAEHAMTAFKAQQKLYEWGYEDLETEINFQISKENLQQAKKDIENILGVL